MKSLLAAALLLTAFAQTPAQAASKEQTLTNCSTVQGDVQVPNQIRLKNHIATINGSDFRVAYVYGELPSNPNQLLLGFAQEGYSVLSLIVACDKLR